MLVSRDRPLRGLILVLDAMLVVASIALAAGLHAALRGHISVLKQPPRFDEYALIVYLTVPLWLVLVAALGLHRTFEREWTRLALVWDLIKLHLAGLVGLSAAVFVTQSTLNRSLVILFLGCSFLLTYAVRSALGFWLAYQHRTGQSRTRLLLVGDDSPQLRAFIAHAEVAPRAPVVVARIATLDELGGALRDEALDRVLFFPPYSKVDQLASSIAACETIGVPAEIAIDVSHTTSTLPRVLDLFGSPFISFDPAPKPLRLLAIKHALDWVVAFAALVVLAPVFLVITIAILIAMGRPVFFTQTRAGLYGRTFRMFKFRTMVIGAEGRRHELSAKNEMNGPVFKVTDDPRVTRLGRLLRKTSIDELPQLMNVFLGQMSLVGPRPLPIGEQQGIRGWHRRRLSMKPGITGIWQVSGRNNIDFEQWMKLDHQYVDDWSLVLDLKILMKTVPVVLLGRGAR